MKWDKQSAYEDGKSAARAAKSVMGYAWPWEKAMASEHFRNAVEEWPEFCREDFKRGYEEVAK